MQQLRSALTPWRALLLAALLLAAQAAGLAHRVAHGPAYGAAAATAAFWGHAAPTLPTVSAADPDHAHPASEAVAECRLYDHLLGHGDALLALERAAASPVPSATAPVRHRTCRSSRHAAAYQARAPPPA